MIPSAKPRVYKAERLAYWYFRLNGFLTTENFIIHPDTGTEQRTDADILAVRFCNRRENLVRPMKDDPKVALCLTFANIIIAEAKTDACLLNGPWTKPEGEDMKRALKALGCVPDSTLDLACDRLYRKGMWRDFLVTIRLFALGEARTEGLCIPDAQQVTWAEVIAFCVDRFGTYRDPKSAVGQWSDDGRQLKDDALSTDPQRNIRQSFCLRPLPDPSGGN